MLNLIHKKLEVWKCSLVEIKNIYLITENFPNKELYGLTNQLRRVSISISSNIAEGVSRSSSKERRRFYEIARSSLVEVDAQIEISKSLKYLDEFDLAKFEDEFTRLFKMLSGLIKSTI